MNRTQSQITALTRKPSAWILIGAFASTLFAVGCSGKSKAAPAAAQAPVTAVVRPAVLQTTPSTSNAKIKPVVLTTTARALKPQIAKPITYQSRDYGLSFVYPWQYAYLSAKAIAEGDASLKPKPDGHDGQFSLVRIDIPRGFYPDSDFESGYFTVSLNQDLDQQACVAALGSAEDGKVQTETINGVDFRWLESDRGGRGKAAKLRNYVAFLNDTCYEFEMGVKTRNQQGLAREVNPDQVFQRLDAMLRTVKMNSAMENASTHLVSSRQAPPSPQP